MSVVETFLHLLERRKLPPRPSGPLPDVDSPDVVSGSGERLVGGETLVLYYTDAEHRNSVRRITVNRVDETHLHAWCHERLANRSFRIHGIRALAALDGTLYDNLSEMLPVTPLPGLDTLEPDIWPEEEQYFWHVDDPHERRFYVLREGIKGEAVLLKAIARSDGTAHRSENDAIVEYLTGRICDKGFAMRGKERAALGRWVHALFPEPFEIDRAVDQLARLSPEKIKRFLVACKTIVVADGKVLPEEVALFDRLGHEILAEYRSASQ